MQAVVDAQYKAVFKSGSLFPGCHEMHVDCCEMVKIPTILSCPAMKCLGVTIFVSVFPSEFNGVVLVSRRASFRVPRFPVVVLPLALAIFCAFRVINPHEVLWDRHNLKLSSNSFSLFQRRHDEYTT